MFDFTAPIYRDDLAARAYIEAHRWPDGPYCPHCGETQAITRLGARAGHPHRTALDRGLWYCKPCVKKFSVTVGTLYERSHIPLSKWLLATHLMCASKKGISAHQIHRMLGITYKSAWFMCHRIREAMREVRHTGPLGGANKVVEVDETYVGGKAANRKHIVPTKEPVVALVERDGKVRSHHVPGVSGHNLRPLLKQHLDAKSYLMTDDSVVYPPLAKELGMSHGTVNHSAKEYVRTGGFHHTNTAENYFSILKRGIIGTYHHVSAAHLKRYLAEFDFRYNERAGLGVNDAQRAVKAVRGIVGKRLTYRRTYIKERGNVVHLPPAHL